MNPYPYYKVFCIFASCFLRGTIHIAQFLLSNHHLTTKKRASQYYIEATLERGLHHSSIGGLW